MTNKTGRGVIKGMCVVIPEKTITESFTGFVFSSGSVMFSSRFRSREQSNTNHRGSEVLDMEIVGKKKIIRMLLQWKNILVRNF